MKSTIISAFALALWSAATFAQTLVPAAPGVLRPVRTDGNAIPGAEPAGVGSDVPRFNLTFPGGKVREFVVAVAKALGKPVNVIIPKEAEATVIPRVDVFGVTVSALFRALGNASKRQILVPDGVPGNAAQYSEFGFSFLSEGDDNSPENVWTFQVMPPPALGLEEPVSTPPLVQYYPIAEYLSHFTVEDITTAIESGWQLQGGDLAKGPRPILRFHEETKLLICAGSSQQVEVIPQVLAGLGQLLGYPRTDNLKITRKAREIIVPKVEVREAMVREVIEFTRKKASENDPEKKGINILLNEVNGPADQKLTFSLADIPVLELLRFTAELAKLNFEIRDTAIVLSTAGTTDSSEAGLPGGVRDAPASPGPGANPNATGGEFQPALGIRPGTPSAPDPATGSVPRPRR